jgi:23S rRNA (cytosine1962-C5)-methyltransferase
VLSLVDHDGRFIGRGLYNPASQIPVRLITRVDEPVDRAFFERRVAAARGLRQRLGLPSERTTAYRLINSEGDELPGLVVDAFGDVLVVQITTLGLFARREQILDALEASLSPGAVLEVPSRSFAALEGFAPPAGLARGTRPERIRCVEDGIRLDVEPLHGQKTGMYVDQRENRIRVGSLSRGARVLDCYAYHGGFALQAARGGAASVVAVDSSPRAVERIRAHALDNELAIEAVEADVFHHLQAALPGSYDLVVLDPPKFARARKDLDAARKGLERLNALALRASAPGALLVTCSCSQNLDAEELERVLAASAVQAGRRVRVLERRGPGPDHPLPPAFPEGRYLSVLLARVEE